MLTRAKKLALFASSNRKLIANLSFAAICLLIAGLFPTGNAAQGVTKVIFSLVIMPLLYVKLAIGSKASDYGFGLGNRKSGLLWGTANLAFLLIVFFLLLRFTDFSKNYRFSDFAMLNFWFFAIYELVFSNISIFAAEFFWRGFVLNSLSDRFGPYSIAIQSAACLVLYATSGTSLWQMLPFLIFSITGGVVAYHSKSVVYSYASQLLAMIFLGAYLVRISH